MKSLHPFQSDFFIKLLFIFACLASSAFVLNYASQPIIDEHGFRQTQTAITAFYLLQNGINFSYWTPVLGEPWSIPFEFPIFQYVLAISSKLFNTPLDSTGRILSWFFTLCCLLPLGKFLSNCGVEKRTVWIVLALFISAPIHVFWGSSCLMESAALFFTLCAIYIGHWVYKNTFSVLFVLAFIIFLLLALLQKSTTVLPVLLAVSLMLCVDVVCNRRQAFVFTKRGLALVLSIILCVLVAALWVKYTDLVKSKNPFGGYITSDALFGWNFGTVGDRFSRRLWSTIIWIRLFRFNLFGVFGLLAVLCSIKYAQAHERKLLLLALFVGFAHPFIFTNLHSVHEYYQMSCLVYFVIALGLALQVLLKRTDAYSKHLSSLIIAVFVVSNVYVFCTRYVSERTEPITVENDRTLSIAQYIRSTLTPEQTFILYGFGWSSEVAFYAERKSISVPGWGDLPIQVAKNPQRFLSSPPAMLLVCEDKPAAELILAIVVCMNRQWLKLVAKCIYQRKIKPSLSTRHLNRVVQRLLST
jgi:hypothetical protein